MTKKKKPQEYKKRGRPSPYDPNRYPEWVRGLASRGMSVEEISKAMNISTKTLYAWRDLYPDFLAALQVGRIETVARLHNTLMKRAEGFIHPTEEKRIQQIGDEKTRRGGDDKEWIVKTQRREVIKKDIYFPPDVGAAKILLVNLDPAFKSERTESQVTGKDGGAIQFADMTDDEITRLAEISMNKLVKKKREQDE